MTTNGKPLAEYLDAAYPFTVVADDGSYFISFPDLPGCMTQVERIEDVGAAADEIRELWLETAYEQGLDIPEPSGASHYSGKFVLRLPRSLHRSLAESAEQEGVSLNQYAATLLAARDALAAVHRRLDRIEQQVDLLNNQLGTVVGDVAFGPEQRSLQVVGQRETHPG